MKRRSLKTDTLLVVALLACLLGVFVFPRSPATKSGASTNGPQPWLDRLGVEAIDEIPTACAEADVIDLNGTDVTDSDLSSLRPLQQLRKLDISGTRLTDQAIPHLLAIASLEELDVVFTGITGRGLLALGEHSGLRSITVWQDQLDADGLAGIEQMAELEEMLLWVDEYGSEDRRLPPKIKAIRPDVSVQLLWFIQPVDQ